MSPAETGNRSPLQLQSSERLLTVPHATSVIGSRACLCVRCLTSTLCWSLYASLLSTCCSCRIVITCRPQENLTGSVCCGFWRTGGASSSGSGSVASLLSVLINICSVACPVSLSAVQNAGAGLEERLIPVSWDYAPRTYRMDLNLSHETLPDPQPGESGPSTVHSEHYE